MIKKLQKRFILIAIISIIIVLSVIMISINVMNYKRVRDYADTVLNTLSKNGGEFYTLPPEFDENRPPLEGRLTDETPYETRFFTIIYKGNGVIKNVNTRQIAAVDTREAVEFAEQAIQKNKNRGYIGIYRYRITNLENGDNLVVFVDCSKQLVTANEFLIISITTSIVGILGVFLIILFLSKKAIQPIAESYEKQKHFITNASHQLKTPLTIISANNDIIEMEYGKNDSTECISKQILRMNSMTKNMTMLAKIDEQDSTKEKSHFNLTDTATNVFDTFSKLASANKILLESNIEDDIQYFGNENLIHQGISIAMENAIKYAKSKIFFDVKTAKNRICITFSNDTIGIEKGKLDKYFERFYRSDEMRASDIEGSGIGLSILKEIVVLHKGRISAYSEDGNIFVLKIIFNK